MADEQIIKLLEEIRDLQKQNAENYKTALQNQQLANQRWEKTAAAAKRRHKWLLVFGVVALISLWTLPFFAAMLNSWLRRYGR